MARKFSELRSKMSAESQGRATARTEQMLREMRLADLRRARELTQQQLASELKVNQAWISKVERQADMYLSTLRSYIEAIGGELDIVARFGDQSVRIKQLDELEVRNEAPTLRESSISMTESSAGAHQNVRVAVYQSQQSSAPQRVEVWSGSGSNTSRPRTPDVNTTSATSRAA